MYLMERSVQIGNNNYFDRMEQPFSIQNKMHIPYNNIKNDTYTNNTNENKKPFKKIIGGSLLLISVIGVALVKGFSSNTANKIIKFFDDMEIKKLSSDNKIIQTLDQSYEKITQKFRNYKASAESFANITAFKDSLFHEFTSWNFLKAKKPKAYEFLSKYLPLQKACDWFTENIFKISRKSVSSDYKKVYSGIDILEAQLQKILNNNNFSSEDTQQIAALLNQITPTFRKGFSQTAIDKRFEIIQNGLKNLDEEVKKEIVDAIKSKDVRKNFLSSYVTNRKAQPTKDKICKELLKNKKYLSYNIDDVNNEMISQIRLIKNLLDTKDIESRKLLANIFKDIKEYSSLKGSDESVKREKISNKIKQSLNELKNSLAKSSTKAKDGESYYSQKESIKLENVIENVNGILDNASEKGLLQKILSKTKETLGANSKEYIQLKKLVDNINKNLNNAIENEGEKMFDKFAEAKVGAIPTDVCGLLSMFGLGAYAIAKGDDKNEKIEATLTKGIPLLGSIAAYFYAGAKAISGVKNLAFSFATGFVLNRIGDTINKLHQKKSQKVTHNSV